MNFMVYNYIGFLFAELWKTGQEQQYKLKGRRTKERESKHRKQCQK